MITGSVSPLVHAAPAGANHVKKVQVHVLDDAAAAAVGAPKVKGGVTEVEVVGTATPTYTARVDTGRVIVDVSDADVDPSVTAITAKAGVVGGVMTQVAESGGKSLTRVSIALTKDSTYRVRVDGTTLRVWLSPVDGADGKPAPGKATAIKDVSFAHDGATDKVMVKLTGQPTYSSSASGPGKSRIELSGAMLPADLERVLDVSAFKGNVSAVSTYKSGGAVILEADRGPDVSADVKVETKDDGTAVLVWTFTKASAAKSDASSVTGVGPDGGIAKKTKTIAKDAPLFVEESSDDSASSFLSSVPMQAGGKYTGRRIDLDFKDADIHNILRLLADVGKVNIVTADDVSGSVTIKMKNVPWDQALDVVLQAKHLGMVRTGNLIRVAKADALEKEREMAIAKKKQELELAPIETRLIPVSYANATELAAKAAELKSPRGSITIDERTNVLIVRDVAGNLDQIEALVHSLDTQTPEVLIEARIVEATSRYLRDVGIQWGGDATMSTATGNPTGLSFPSRIGVVGGGSDQLTPTAGLSPATNLIPNPNFAVNLPATVGTGQGGGIGFSLGSINNVVNLNVRLSAAETNGMLRIISSPRILTLDNREATISQGTMIPFSQISAQGVQTTFQEAKLALVVKPHVTADGSIAMHVRINRDEPDFNQTSARGDPTILKRQAETDLLVPDGATVVIGGIFTRNTGRSIDQVPFFGSIPIIGILFQRRRASDTRSELVIFLTPRIVNRAEALGK
ncbi:MAG: type IV pilus secretin PilQ [Deltaproteobacteria bacterium]|nr:type IV pilus secretin PilQ [Deltaproteobacteria bacterium]